MYGGYTSYFSRIAIDSLHKALSTKKQIDALRDSEPPKYRKLSDLHYNWLSSFLSCIVFTAFTLESYINGYGVRRLTESYFRDYLDKLSLEGKWTVILKLVTGQSITGTKGHQLLKKVIKARNLLAHDRPKHKKLVGKEDVETVVRYYDGGKDLSKEVDPWEAVKTIVLLDQRLKDIDDEASIFPLVDTYFESRWKELSE